MARFLKNKEASLGQVPGELIFIGEQKVQETSIRILDYDQEHLNEQYLQDIKDGIPYKDSPTVTWLNIYGLHDTEFIKSIGKAFGLHALVLEDISNTGQRPKMEEYDDYIFFVLKMMRYDEEEGKIHSEQLSMVLGKTFLLTFHERPADVFEPVRDRIRKQKGRIRKVGIDYLAYALLDTIVDNYIFIIERLGEQIEDIEDEILESPTQEVLTKINNYKREMNYLRKSIRPAKEFILQLSRLDSDLIQEQTVPFIKDLLDLVSQAVEVIDTYREMLSDHLNIYNTGVSNRLNEIMKVLTIFSAIFIPLTFIAGIYGTNFEHVPELHYRYSYFVFWGVMLTVALVMLRFFRRKNWI
ncbi:MAG: magnesium/cobalt transporter CorA [Proteobacteria bacterium]|nr:magnesium/cobalt transporter CorA [Pseudomonadota bacterium]MBU1419431.1 magnesium/cobalt transporter CorA [Pseudomonadota bacterium]MBU1456300.1 magnesium/cobalt transporter CorA [Pseudomonadota bacterium]